MVVYVIKSLPALGFEELDLVAEPQETAARHPRGSFGFAFNGTVPRSGVLGCVPALPNEATACLRSRSSQPPPRHDGAADEERE